MDGKTPHKRTPHARKTLIPIHTKALQSYHNTTLAEDVMYVNGICFINIISCYINFMTSDHITNAEYITLQNSIKQVKRVYSHQGFKFVKILMGGKFECIHGDLSNAQVHLSIFSNNKQLGDIEHTNRKKGEGPQDIQYHPFKKGSGPDDCGARHYCIFLAKCHPSYYIHSGGP